MNDDRRIRFLIVDDEAVVREICACIGEAMGFRCQEAGSAEDALALIERDAPDIVVTDLRLPEKSGMELLELIKSRRPHTEVAIMTGHGTIGSAVQAMKLGAYHYITKPFAVEEMKLMLERMAEKVRLMVERDRLRERVRELESGIAQVGGPAGANPATTWTHSSVEPQAPTDLEHLEKVTIQRVFQQVHGDKVLARKMLGISRATLYRKLKRYNLIPQAEHTPVD